MERTGLDLDELYAEHGADLVAYARRLTGDPHTAEDLAHDAMLRAWHSTNQPTEPDQVRRWLFTITRNLVIDDARSARRRRELPRETLPEQAEADRADAVFDSIVVRDALAGLSPAHREVVVHAYFRHRSVAEIAEELGIAPGTVKSRLHYGLRALRLALLEQGVIR